MSNIKRRDDCTRRFFWIYDQCDFITILELCNCFTFPNHIARLIGLAVACVFELNAAIRLVEDYALDSSLDFGIGVNDSLDDCDAF